jgi:hypothetical protein
VAVALQETAAGSRSRSLHITSCKLTAADPYSTAILRALPASKLTSLEFEISVPGDPPAPDVLFKMSKHPNMLLLGLAFKKLQQLRQLNLSVDHSLDDIGVGYALRHMSALTNLTSLNLPEV